MKSADDFGFNLRCYLRICRSELGAGVKYNGCNDKLVVCLGSNSMCITALIR